MYEIACSLWGNNILLTYIICVTVLFSKINMYLYIAIRIIAQDTFFTNVCDCRIEDVFIVFKQDASVYLL